ncbi:DEAD/DEAH box helicase [Crenobacter sp. SG2303]|uniref:ATP-dependent RNA helicase RhlE n=1 Tax=Crenobacter oryzisoli TaxID=3056844 RepID=A0ABT7XL04_9NEIS|nr:DEAD/DEAH box helicase [Crenobacter sp. SG2303]MDN0074477.1 DEAD/DEAH box helicase [Crenobacter sp. SG2303]
MTTTTFADLGLAEPLLRAVADTGYTTPTPIQAQAIPQVIQGGDLLAAAQTGTGKTAGFTLPLLHLLSAQPVKRAGRPRALVLTPTRELAAQVEESVRTYGKYLPLKSMVMFGGVGINPQIAALRKPVDILVATPGRLLDHAGQKTIDLSGVDILVLDEADRMLDMGFIHDIKKVLALLPAKRQNLLFSATFSDDIKALADKLLDNPGLVEVARRNTANELVDQKVHLVDRDKKTELLTQLIKDGSWQQVLVFTRTKHGANRLAEKLDKSGIPAAAIHGNKSQNARTKALADFKSNDLQVLVATDIAARGLDIDQLPHVVNFELPNVPEDYVHRIGRTGRAGASGEAVSLVCVDELKLLKDIEKLIKKPVPQFTIPGFEADLTVPPEPIVRGRQQQGGQRRGGHADGRAPQGRGSHQQGRGNGQAKAKPAQQTAKAPQAAKSAQPSKPAQAKPQGQAKARQDGQGQRDRAPQGKGQQQPAAHAGQRRGPKQQTQRGEANGNVMPPPPREVNGNVIPAKKQDVNGNRVASNPPRGRQGGRGHGQTAALFSAPRKPR